MEELLKDPKMFADVLVQAVKDAVSENNPRFPVGNVPVKVAARVYGRDENWVRAGIINGWLPIGIATRDGNLITDLKQMDSKYGRVSYQISPKKLYEDTGYIWKGEKDL